MKGLTLWQPWASLIGRGKYHETRSWSTPYRGPVAIHAGLKKPVRNEFSQLTLQVIDQILGDSWPTTLPLGCILAVAQLTDCSRTDNNIKLDPVDRLLGDYSEGRWVWELSQITVLTQPIAFKGRQGLWNVPAVIAHQLMSQEKI